MLLLCFSSWLQQSHLRGLLEANPQNNSLESPMLCLCSIVSFQLGGFLVSSRVATFTRYGLPFVSENNILISTINGAGAAIEIVYVLIFLLFAPKKERAKIFGLFMIVLTVFAAVTLVSLLALHGNTRKIFCGFAADIFSIIMYASPLFIMRTVIKTKSVEYMPFLLSLFVFLCGTSWFVFGLLGRDPFVAVPNGFGSGLGTMQLILYFIYHKKGEPEKVPMGANGSVEMGLEKPLEGTKMANGTMAANGSLV